MTNHLQLFPVHNSADLRRAIRHVERTGDEAERKHVINRARALGRSDLIPTGWVVPNYRITHQAKSLDEQFDAYADQFGISAVKLKAVFFRGVQEYEASDADFGNAAVWGMARVQRFINGSCDEDLRESETSCSEVQPDPGLELSADSIDIVYQFIYGDMRNLFSPGEVMNVEIHDNMLYVQGTLDDEAWRYSINLTTGEHELNFE